MDPVSRSVMLLLLCLLGVPRIAFGLQLDSGRQFMVADQLQLDCRTAVEGDECHQEVAWAMEVGIAEHPAWYPTLTRNSSFEEFQRVLSGMERVSEVCLKPCEAQCRTAVPGDECYNEVLWAMHEGITAHPDWYPTLSNGSTFREVQRFLHSLARLAQVCARPCAAEAHLAKLVDASACKTASEGDECWTEVMWAKQVGVAEHPNWYPTLTQNSSFEKFQMVLSGMERVSDVCLKPCEAQCRTAVPGDACHKEVLWAMNDGIPAHPGWYPALANRSTFEDVQEYLHGLERLSHVCPRPCRAPKSGERLPAKPSAYPSVDGYVQVATNCECGTKLEDHPPQPDSNEEWCAAWCDSMDECKSFALWSQDAWPTNWRGYCRLYDSVCNATHGWEANTKCVKPTHNSNDPYVFEQNVAYNRIRFPTPAPTVLHTPSPPPPTLSPTEGPTLAPGQVCPCERCASFPFWDLDGDGCLVQEEVSKVQGFENFDAFDTNLDGCINRTECDANPDTPNPPYIPGDPLDCDVGYYLDPATLQTCLQCTGGATRRRNGKGVAGSCTPCGKEAFDAGDFDDCITGIYLTEDAAVGSKVLEVNKVDGLATRDHIFIATRVPGHFEEAVVVGLPGEDERRRLRYSNTSAGIVLDEPLTQSFKKYDAITIICSHRDGITPANNFPCGCGAVICSEPSICHINVGGTLQVDPITSKASGSSGYCQPLLTVPTPAPTVSAKGDPHLVNLQGEHFDINHGGEFDMLRIPSDTRKPADFVLRASIRPEFGKPCTTFITEVELTGSWFDNKAVKVRSYLQSHSGNETDKFLGVQVLERGAPEQTPWTSIADWSKALVMLSAPQSNQEVTVSKTMWSSKGSSKKRARAGMPTLGGQFVFSLRSKRNSEAAKVIIRQDLPVQEHLNVAVRRLSALGSDAGDVGGLLGFGGHPDSLEEVTPECWRHRNGLDGKKGPREPAWKTRWNKIRVQRHRARDSEAAASFMCVCPSEGALEDPALADQDDGREAHGIVTDLQTARLAEVSWD